LGTFWGLNILKMALFPYGIRLLSFLKNSFKKVQLPLGLPSKKDLVKN